MCCILEIEILRVLGIRIYENVIIVITLYIHFTFLRFGQITQCSISDHVRTFRPTNVQISASRCSRWFSYAWPSSIIMGLEFLIADIPQSDLLLWQSYTAMVLVVGLTYKANTTQLMFWAQVDAFLHPVSPASDNSAVVGLHQEDKHGSRFIKLSCRQRRFWCRIILLWKKYGFSICICNSYTLSPLGEIKKGHREWKKSRKY